MAKDIGVGVIGLGMGRHVLRVNGDDTSRFVVKGICDLDEEKMERYGRFYAEKGDYYARFLVDERRPNWFPIVDGR